jgi:transcription elongation GreA/GreB family factor
VGLISIGSPLGKALLNREVGDEVVVATPKGRRTFQIVDLRTFHDREGLKTP